jgi:EmrB/QacA subfamily drug resistance transporter
MVLGFFMILVDSTIVSVATPAIMEGLQAGVNEVIWVTSAYLLAYAVPLLITGRLGDRLGPRNLYLSGLTVFTLASLWCGLTGSIAWLIVARVVQGLGAAMLTPQTMAVITRTFPPNQRGAAMGLWGATSGVAMLVGPLAGGLLVDGFGWEWIFFINLPVGVIGFVMAWILVPKLPTHRHRFDIPGVFLSAAALFFIVFGLQEGEKFDWGQIWGPITVWQLIVVGVLLLGVFIWQQARTRTEALVPLGLFRDRNFSVANVAITTVGCSITAMGFPFMLYAQVVRGLSPTESALLLAPMAVLSGALAPVSGRLTDRLHPRWLAPFGVAGTAVSLYWVSRVMTPNSAVWELLLPMGLMGIANAFMWGPLGATATRNLPMHSAGAGAGIYNTTRQVGAVFGSAAIATLIDARLAAHLPGMGSSDQVQHLGAALPPRVADGFAAAMSDAMLLPALVLLVGLVATICFAAPSHTRRP